MFKNLSTTTKLFAGLIVAVIVIMIIIISISGNKTPGSLEARYLNDNASADNKVEALKTMTADLLSVENKNKQLQKTVDDFQTKNKDAMNDLKKSVNSQVQQAIQQIQQQNQEKQQSFENNLKQKEISPENDSPVKGDQNNSSFVWIADVSKNKPSITSKKSNDSSNSLNSLLGPDKLLDEANSPKKKKIKPVYTIPLNATLTGSTLMTPLVGRIPLDGKLPSPYYFKLVLSAKNLTANGYPMPGIKGAVMSGVASGDMLGRCARGDINSISFIFNDGTISSTQSTGDNDSLGYISSQTGNPCIAGTFHSNAAIFLGAQMMLSGAQGYANAISSSQYMNSTTPDGGTISTLVGSADKAAIGQGGSAAAQAAQTWWNQRVENSFDYVYVPNINPKTGKPMKVVVNITQQIPINYDPNARKVNYESSIDALNSHLD